MFWKAVVAPEGTVVFSWGGTKPGSKIQRVVDTPEPKCKNTPYQQALQVARNKARQKLRKGYVQVEGDPVEATTGTVGDATARPMLVSWWHDRERFLDPTDVCDYQYKLDGCRGLLCLDTGVVASRGGKRFANDMPELAAAVPALRAALAGTGVTHVDGELLVVDDRDVPLPFQEVVKVLRKKGRDSSGVRFAMFDVVMDGAADWPERRVVLDGLKASPLPPVLEVVESRTGTISDLDAELHEAVYTAGTEGVIVRLHADSPYLASGKRSTRVIKAKYFQDAEFEVVGFELQKGTADQVGAVVLKTTTGKTFKATPGAKDKGATASPWGAEDARRRLWAEREHHIGRRATVKYQEMTTSSDPVPRFPNFMDFRD